MTARKKKMMVPVRYMADTRHVVPYSGQAFTLYQPIAAEWAKYPVQATLSDADLVYDLSGEPVVVKAVLADLRPFTVWLKLVHRIRMVRYRVFLRRRS